MIRGKGLMIGMELWPETGRARHYCHKLKEKGLLCKETHENIIRFAPPLVITKDVVDWALEQIEAVL
jgi:ornithine--oxo-acid transaminase